jgi:hypothetical protein
MNDKRKMEELLSAYLDRELPYDERKRLEEKIKSSPEMQKKLLEMEQVKNLTSSAYKKLEENPYFETRLNVSLNNTNPKFRFKKWTPALGFVVLTLAIMLVLKFNPNLMNSLLLSQKTNIENFYTSNLKPVLASVGLNNEDVFNFAFNKQLPLDSSKNQYLQVYSDPKGNNYVEIKIKQLPENYNLEKFVTALNLNTKQKAQMDSILNSYADQLKSQVLVNDNNTLAINANLWNYHRAILADIMSFAQRANQKAFNQIVPAAYQVLTKPSVVRMVNEVKSKPDSQFIFVTPDSVFSKPLKIDMNKFKRKMKDMSGELKKNLQNLSKNYKNFRVKINIDSNFVRLNNDSSWSKNFKVYVDTNSYRVQIPRFTIPNINVQVPNFDSLTANIEEAFKNFNWNDNKGPKTYSRSYKYKYEKGDTSLLKNFRMNIPNIDSLLKLNKVNKDSVMIYGFDKNGHRLHLNLDSLMYQLPFYSDSMFYHNQKEFEKQMKGLQQEIENFREEMKSFQKDFKNPNTNPDDSIPKPFRGKKTVQI